MNAFEFLGLRRDADEREVKRAYAQRLKQVRPDEDPQGFQQLHEMYQSALRITRNRVAVAVEEAADDAGEEWQLGDTGSVAELAVQRESRAPVVLLADAPAASTLHFAEPAAADVAWQESRPDIDTRAPINSSLRDVQTIPVSVVEWSRQEPAAPVIRATVAVAPPRFDFEAFFASITETAASGNVEDLRDQLGREPALWSFDVKNRIGRQMLTALHERTPPMPGESFDALLAFFDLDHVLAGVDAAASQRLRTYLQLQWELRPAHIDRLAARTNAEPGRSAAGNIAVTRRLMGALSGNVSWLSVLWQALRPKRPTTILAFLFRLDAGRLDRLSPPLDARRIAFWRKAGDRSRMSWPRIAVGAARCIALIVLLPLLLGPLFTFLDQGRSTWLKNTAIFLQIGLGLSALWLWYILWQSLREWQAADENPQARGRWRRIAFIPTLAATAVAYAHISFFKDENTAYIGGALAALALVLAILRYRARARSKRLQITLGWGGWIVAACILRGIVAESGVLPYVPEITAALALAVWATDLWKQRTHLRAAA